MFRARFAAGLLLVLALDGCTSVHVMSHVPLSTMARLSTLTMGDIDPDALRVAARLPMALEPQLQGVKVRLGVVQNSSKFARNEEFVLEPVTGPGELGAVVRWQRPGSRLWVYRVSSDDVIRLRRLMSEASAAGTRGVSISAGVEACHRAPLGSASLPSSTFLRTNRSGYFVLTDNLDIRRIVSDRDLATKVPPC